MQCSAGDGEFTHVGGSVREGAWQEEEGMWGRRVRARTAEGQATHAVIALNELIQERFDSLPKQKEGEILLHSSLPGTGGNSSKPHKPSMQSAGSAFTFCISVLICPKWVANDDDGSCGSQSVIGFGPMKGSGA